MSRSHEEAKLAKLVEIEGYDSIEALMEAVLSDAVSPALRNGTGSGRRLLRRVPHQLDESGAGSRRPHLGGGHEHGRRQDDTHPPA